MLKVDSYSENLRKSDLPVVDNYSWRWDGRFFGYALSDHSQQTALNSIDVVIDFRILRWLGTSPASNAADGVQVFETNLWSSLLSASKPFIHHNKRILLKPFEGIRGWRSAFKDGLNSSNAWIIFQVGKFG